MTGIVGVEVSHHPDIDCSDVKSDNCVLGELLLEQGNKMERVNQAVWPGLRFCIIFPTGKLRLERLAKSRDLWWWRASVASQESLYICLDRTYQFNFRGVIDPIIRLMIVDMNQGRIGCAVRVPKRFASYSYAS